ncbi:MAG: hypothetical protein R2754_14185 [Microthrixaceae bacterium]
MSISQPTAPEREAGPSSAASNGRPHSTWASTSSRRARRPEKGTGPGRWTTLLAGPTLAFALLQWMSSWGRLYPNVDTLAYLQSGESLLAGDGFARLGRPELHFPPAVPVGLASLADLLGSELAALRAWNVAWNLVVAVLVVALAHRFWGDRRRTVIAAWLAATAPGAAMIVKSGGASEAPATAGLLLALVLVHPLLTRNNPARAWPLVGGAALACGFAYLCRPETLLGSLIIGAAVVGSARYGADPAKRLGLAVRRGALFGLALVAVMAPYMSYLHTHTGSWSPTAKAQDVSMEAWRAVADDDRLARDRVLYAIAPDGVSLGGPTTPLLQLARDHPDEWLGIVGANVRRTSGILLVPGDQGWQVIPAPLLAAAVAMLVAERRRPGRLLLATVAAAPLLTSLVFFSLPRYLYPLGVLAMVPAAGALDWVWRRWGRRAGQAAVGAAVVMSLATGMTALNRAVPWSAQPLDAVAAAQWASQHLPTDARVMTRSYLVQHYVQREVVALPSASSDETLAFARRMGVTHLVLDDTLVERRRPELVSWLESDDPEGLRLVKRVDEHWGRGTVWALDPPPPPSDLPPLALGYVSD